MGWSLMESLSMTIHRSSALLSRRDNIGHCAHHRYITGPSYRLGLGGWMLVLASIFLVICISSPAVGIVNWLATLLVMPHALPRMDFSSAFTRSANPCGVPSVLTSPEKLKICGGSRGSIPGKPDINLHFVF